MCIVKRRNVKRRNVTDTGGLYDYLFIGLSLDARHNPDVVLIDKIYRCPNLNLLNLHTDFIEIHRYRVDSGIKPLIYGQTMKHNERPLSPKILLMTPLKSTNYKYYEIFKVTNGLLVLKDVSHYGPSGP